MFCKECGMNIPDGARFCPVCRAEQNQRDTYMNMNSPTMNRNTTDPRVVYNRQTGMPNAGIGRAEGTNTYGDWRSTVSKGASNALRAAAGVIDDASTNSAVKTQPKGILMDGMVLAEGEKIVRQYDCCLIKKPKCVGRLSVTNKRVVFQGSAGNSRISDEIEINKVTGVSGLYGKYYHWVKMIFGLILALGGIGAFISLCENYSSRYRYSIMSAFSDVVIIICIALVTIGVLLFCKGITDTYYLIIYASECAPSPIIIGRSNTLQRAEIAVRGNITEDTNRMLNELGALVQDLKTMGDHAIQKWSP